MSNKTEVVRAKAKAHFVRVIIAVVTIGAATVVGALFVLSRSGDMSADMIIAVVAGVFVSVVLGAGLMAAGFYSSRSGHDDDASGLSRSRTLDD